MLCFVQPFFNVDGLSHKWEEGVPSSYETNAGQFLDEDIPVAIRRLVDPTGIKVTDCNHLIVRDSDLEIATTTTMTMTTTLEIIPIIRGNCSHLWFDRVLV